jgi:hypothetical protein
MFSFPELIKCPPKARKAWKFYFNNDTKPLYTRNMQAESDSGKYNSTDMRRGSAKLLAKWSHPNSLEPVMKGLSSGRKLKS